MSSVLTVGLYFALPESELDLDRIMESRIIKYLSYPIGLLVALTVFSLIMLIINLNPLSGFQAIFYGSFGTLFSFGETFVRVTPLLLTTLAFLIAFKGRFLNIGAEGQLYIGALSAYLAASQLGWLPSVFSIPLVMIASALGGIAWLAIPLVMRTKLGINEIFPTVVMNFIAGYIISWLTTGPLKDPLSINPQTRVVPTSTWLPVLIPGTRLHAGLVVSLVLALFLYLILNRMVLGYEIRAVGLNPNVAKHSGINVNRSIIWVGLMSGGLSGLAGMVEVIGTHHLLIQGFSPGFGFQGIAIAALGAFNPLGAIVSSILFSVLLIGGESMQRGAGVPVDMIFILQAVLIFSVLIVETLITSRRK